jgi:Co/Zn/Cd efflux system component
MVALANLTYFVVEAYMAGRLVSAALFADSADFLEDAAVNLLILMALRWSAPARARVGFGLAFLLLVPVAGWLWALWFKLSHAAVPNAVVLSEVGLGALVVNIGCALLLVRFRAGGDSLVRAAFLSARNDALANIGIIAAGGLTYLWPSIWPDLVVGFGIALLNLDAAREVWQAARRDSLDHPPAP